ncbi:DUF1851 domain-containing protein [Streptomyces sp. PmtA]|uniref:T6SS immunity protein Tdi1 domain-containing protein n=1 Tax=Streptomyces sp. PmtA TaxID=3074275 RepID=UPI003015475A
MCRSRRGRRDGHTAEQLISGSWSPTRPPAFDCFDEGRKANPGAGPVGFDQVVGYKVPLSLGGADDVANLELTDRQVYVELCAQIALQLRES